MIVTLAHAETHLSDLLAAAERGEDVTIARDHRPAVRLVVVPTASEQVGAEPVVRRKPRRFGAYAGQFELSAHFFDPLPDDELAAWSGDAA